MHIFRCEDHRTIHGTLRLRHGCSPDLRELPVNCERESMYHHSLFPFSFPTLSLTTPGKTRSACASWRCTAFVGTLRTAPRIVSVARGEITLTGVEFQTGRAWQAQIAAPHSMTHLALCALQLLAALCAVPTFLVAVLRPALRPKHIPRAVQLQTIGQRPSAARQCIKSHTFLFAACNVVLRQAMVLRSI